MAAPPAGADAVNRRVLPLFDPFAKGFSQAQPIPDCAFCFPFVSTMFVGNRANHPKWDVLL
jgi:hypothetical protein